MYTEHIYTWKGYKHGAHVCAWDCAGAGRRAMDVCEARGIKKMLAGDDAARDRDRHTYRAA